MPKGLPKQGAGMPQRKDVQKLGRARGKESGAARKEQGAICSRKDELGAEKGEREPLKEGEAMKEDVYETLSRIREKTKELDRAKESLARLEAVYRSPSFDDMPRGGGKGDAMERRMCALEELEGRIKEIDGEVREMTDGVRPEIRKLPEHLYTFCISYYLAARSIRDICMVMQRAKPTVMRYKDELQEWFK